MLIKCVKSSLLSPPITPLNASLPLMVFDKADETNSKESRTESPIMLLFIFNELNAG